MEHLCKCNNCDKIMYDENPQTNAPKIDTTLITVTIFPMELLNDGNETFWGCGDCQTDSYLSDVDNINQIHLNT